MFYQLWQKGFNLHGIRINFKDPQVIRTIINSQLDVINKRKGPKYSISLNNYLLSIGEEINQNLNYNIYNTFLNTRSKPSLLIFLHSLHINIRLSLAIIISP